MEPIVHLMDEPDEQPTEGQRAAALLVRLGAHIDDMRAVLADLLELADAGAVYNDPPFEPQSLDEFAVDFEAWRYTLDLWEGVYYCQMKPGAI